MCCFAAAPQRLSTKNTAAVRPFSEQISGPPQRIFVAGAKAKDASSGAGTEM
jgi:hypothetical protein